MIRRPPRSTRTDTLLPYKTLVRSSCVSGLRLSSTAEREPRLHLASGRFDEGALVGAHHVQVRQAARGPLRHAGQRTLGHPPGERKCRLDQLEIGRAHVCTPVTHAHLVCHLLLTKKNTTQKHY